MVRGRVHYADQGDAVRIQPNHISFTSAQAIKDIHGFRAHPVKGECYTNLMQPAVARAPENILSTTYPRSCILTKTVIAISTINFEQSLEEH